MTPTPDQVGLYRFLFGRVDDAYGEVVDGKVATVRESVTEGLIEAHLTGSRHLGFFLVDPDGMVDRGYIDVDIPKHILKDPTTTENDLQEQWEAARRRVLESACVLAAVGVEFYVESSRSKGFHIAVHTVDPIPAGLMKQLLTAVTVEAKIKAEVFPKQEARGPDGLGNFVFGMLHGKSISAGKTVVVNWQNGFHPVPDSWEVLEGLKRNSLETIGAALAYLQGGATALSPSPGGCSDTIQQPLTSQGGPDLLPAGLLSIGFEKCTVLDSYRWNATEAGRLTTGEGEGEHAARIALANYCRVFDGGEKWAVDAIFRHLEDYDPVETRKQLASLKGKPPLCRSLCPGGLCDDMKDAGGSSPIKFAFMDGRAHGYAEQVDTAPAKAVPSPVDNIKSNMPSRPDPRVVVLENMKTRSVRELLADDTLTEPEPALDGIFGLGEVLVLGGPPKAMKSWTVKSIGLCMASGQPWLGFKVPRPLRVIYLSAEGLEARLRARFQTLIGFAEVEEQALERLHSVSTLGRIKLDTDAGEATFLRLIDPFEVVIVDPYYRFQEKGVENSHDDQRKMQDLMDRVKGMGKAIIVVHHLRKPGLVNAGIEELRGAGLSGFTDSAVILNRAKSKSDDRFTATFDIRNYEPVPDMELLRQGVILTQTEAERKAPGGVTPEDVAKILTQLGPLSMTKLCKQISELHKVSDATAERAVAEAVKLRIVLKGPNRTGKYFTAESPIYPHAVPLNYPQGRLEGFKDE